MVDKITFMETLRSVQEIARTGAKPMTKEEIQGYFQDMDLTKEQQDMVYQYLSRPQEESAAEAGENLSENGKGEDGLGEDGRKGRTKDKGTEENISAKSGHSPHFQMYLNEIKGISALGEEEKGELYQRLLAGEKTVIAAISSQWLKRVTEMAEPYITDRVLLEDLVQEGNMGLLLGLEKLSAGQREEKNSDVFLDCLKLEQKLEFFVEEAMRQYRQEIEGADSGESTVLAKVNLVYEAQKVLAEERGTIPTLEELSEYTRIPRKEIGDILALSEKKGEKR